MAARAGLTMSSSSAMRTAPSTSQRPTSALVGQKELFHSVSDASDKGDADILGCDTEGQDFPPGWVCVEQKDEEQEQSPHPLSPAHYMGCSLGLLF